MRKIDSNITISQKEFHQILLYHYGPSCCNNGTDLELVDFYYWAHEPTVQFRIKTKEKEETVVAPTLETVVETPPAQTARSVFDDDIPF